MMETLILVNGGAIYRFLDDYNYEVWTHPSWAIKLALARRDRGRIVKLELGQPLRLTYYASSLDSECFDASPVLRWTTLYDGKMTFEEALYNAEWLEGYEYRIHTRGKVLSINAANPFKKGTPEQKWWEAGYWAAIKEAKEMRCTLCSRQSGHANACPRAGEQVPPVVELPDAKVEILLKLNERLASQEKSLKLAFGEFGNIVYHMQKPDDVAKEASARNVLKGIESSIASLKTAIGVVKALA